MYEMAKRISKLEEEVKQLKESSEKNSINTSKALYQLIDIMNGYNVKVSEALVLLKHSIKEKHQLTNKQVGLPACDSEAILALRKQGLTQEAIAKELGYSRSTVIRRLNKYKEQEVV